MSGRHGNAVAAPACRGALRDWKHAHDLIDDYQLVICPVVLGRGKRPFGERPGPADLQLAGTRSFDQGAVLLQYSPAGSRS